MRRSTKILISIACLYVLGGILILCIPVHPLFTDPYCTVVEDKDGHLLAAQIAADDQWRFPLSAKVPEHFRKAVIRFEDKRFYRHPGIDLRAVLRAVKINIQAGKIKSGASTLTMQLARLSRKDKPRTVVQKLIEMAIALKLELVYSKDEILALWSAHAPFGGNIIGLEAASWRYFHKSPNLLSLSEAACLAVLPNAPSLIHPGKNRETLKKKRDTLLKKMYESGLTSEVDFELAVFESIPEAPHPIPQIAPHVLQYLKKHQGAGSRFVTTMDRNIQEELLSIANYHAGINRQSGIENLAMLVLDSYTGEVVAYIGNSPGVGEEHAVDMVQGMRSSGSVLKPLLYASMLDKAQVLPTSLVLDIPTHIQGFHPENYNREYLGAVRADEAISKSLNVPAVRALQQYGVPLFLNDLRQMGFRGFQKDADHYGLSLILGGGEISLWELCGVYASLGRTLTRYNTEESKYAARDFRLPSLKKVDITQADQYDQNVLSAGAIYHAFQAMEKLVRPDAEGMWQKFETSRRIAWKTGTSFGHKDAWAIGVSQKYTIGVWVGNADGEGIHGLVGVKKAAPILFDILNRLPEYAYFDKPVDALEPVDICAVSGFRSGAHCPVTDTVDMLPAAKSGPLCSFHQTIYVNEEGFQVNNTCALLPNVKAVNYFVLPAQAAVYYRKQHPEYRVLPSYDPDCSSEISNSEEMISIAYPAPRAKIYLPLDAKGNKEKIVFRAVHKDPERTLYWHLDDQYLGETKEFHSMSTSPSPGKHTLLITDESGNSSSTEMEFIGH
jgi:penicillin-binding protein 1C